MASALPPAGAPQPPPSPWPARWADAAWCLLYAVMAVAVRVLGRAAEQDPDRAFHVELSRRIVDEGFVRELPQLVYLQWSREFVDKEFLFHVLTSLGYRVAGPAGVVAAGLACSVAVLWAAYAVARRFLPPAVAGPLVLAVLVGQPMFLYRLLLLRAYVLGLAATGALLWGLLARHRLVVGLAGFVFASGYHAWYMPLAALGLFVVMAGRPRRDDLVLAAVGVTGLVLGVVTNPYFPGTLGLSGSIVQLAFHSGARGQSGTELWPMDTRALLEIFGGSLLATGGALALLWRAPGALGSPAARLALSWAGLTWTLTLLNPRAAEYAVPATALLLAIALGRSPSRWAWGLWAALLGLQLPQARALLVLPAEQVARLADLQGLDAIPRDGQTHVAVHCYFQEGTWLFGRRPDVGVTEVLDPLFLERDAPGLARAKAALLEGSAFDPGGVVGSMFHADIVTCLDPVAWHQFQDSTDFVPLWPRPGTPALRLRVFQRRPSAAAVRHFMVDGAPAAPPDQSAYLDLGARRPAPGACVTATVAPEEVAARAGARLALVGGGPRARLRVNGRLVFDSGVAWGRPARHRAWVPLPEPVAAGDLVSVESCADGTTSWAGVALELWDLEAARAFCQARGTPWPQATGVPGTADEGRCVAPWAAVALPPP